MARLTQSIEDYLSLILAKPRKEAEFYLKIPFLTATASYYRSRDTASFHFAAGLLLLCLTLLSPIALKADSSAVILQYHHVSAETPVVTSITPKDFEEHIETIVLKEYNVMPLDVIVETLQDRQRLPDKTVAITFDDAYKNIFTNAYPVLKRYKLPFTVFVATNYVRENSTQFLSWTELEEMSANGAIIANHSASHTHLLRELAGESKKQRLERIKQEILIAEEVLESNLNQDKTNGFTHKLFAYPYGEFDSDIENIIQTLGYVGFGQQSGPAGEYSNFLALPRFPLSGKYSDFESFKIKLATLPLPIKNEHRNPLLNAEESRPLLELNFLDSELDLSDLRCFGPSGLLVVNQTTPGQASTRASIPLPAGRSRYNCTMPVAGSNPERFYWFSQLWIRKNSDSSWYSEN